MRSDAASSATIESAVRRLAGGAFHMRGVQRVADVSVRIDGEMNASVHNPVS